MSKRSQSRLPALLAILAEGSKRVVARPWQDRDGILFQLLLEYGVRMTSDSFQRSCRAVGMPSPAPRIALVNGPVGMVDGRICVIGQRTPPKQPAAIVRASVDLVAELKARLRGPARPTVVVVDSIFQATADTTVVPFASREAARALLAALKQDVQGPLWVLTAVPKDLDQALKHQGLLTQLIYCALFGERPEAVKRGQRVTMANLLAYIRKEIGKDDSGVGLALAGPGPSVREHSALRA